MRLLLVLALTACTIQPQPPIQTTTTTSLDTLVELELQACANSKAYGYVTNHSDRTVDVFVQIHFLDRNGDIIEDSNDWVRGIRPGERGRWEALWLGPGIYRSCRAEIDSVFGA